MKPKIYNLSRISFGKCTHPKNVKTMSKKTMTILSLAFCILTSKAQTIVADFETFSLSANSAYSPTTSTPFHTSNASFQYSWDNTYSFWSGGFSYTNKYDSSTAGFTNLYGVRAYKGYTNSATYVVGQDRGVIRLAAGQNTVNGFYITNTTYAYKAMASGSQFSRKFGDTTGTGSGTTIPQGSYPDFFKVIIKGYQNGTLKSDSVTAFLANYTFTNNAQDYILNTWQYVNTSAIGTVDSIKFFMRSSDVGQYGINTPLFFAIDNFETSAPSTVGIIEHHNDIQLSAYPNPFTSFLNIRVDNRSIGSNAKIRDIAGKLVREEVLSEEINSVDLSTLQPGIYFLELDLADQKTIKKIIKN
jgi:hypothetical protein